MEAVLDKEVISTEEAAKLKTEQEKDRKRNFVISEETNFKVCRFQNNEEKGVPLEFSAGAPISKENRNYVLKDGKCYLLGERVRRHIKSLGYPIYENVPDPENPTEFRSMQTGFQRRFGLSEVEESDMDKVVVYEHLREKLNRKVLPGALENNAVIPGRTDPLKDKRYNDLEKDNTDLREIVEEITKTNETLIENNAKQSEDVAMLIEANKKLMESQAKKKGK